MGSRIYKRMDELLSKRKNIHTIQAKIEDKFIIFSDLHRGLSDKADDFKDSNERSYRAALSHYFHNNFHLVHLGDVEELKEQLSIGKVIKHHESLMQLEKLFHNKERFYKVFGNHDSQWGNPKKVKRHLHSYFNNIQVYEGIILKYNDLPNIFLVHGHQGYSWLKTNVAEKVFLPIYRIALNIFGIERKTNYESYCKIEKIENEFYDWAIDLEDILVIFGHTHRPLWGSSTHIDSLEKELEAKRTELEKVAHSNGKSVKEVISQSHIYRAQELVDALKKIINRIKEKMSDSGVCRAPIPLPLIFNSGNCINKDGDITGIEIVNGHIKLVKWGIDGGAQPVRFEYESGDLSSFII